MMQFFDVEDDTPEKRIGKVIGAVIVTIIYSGIAALMIYAISPVFTRLIG
jgi:hypothetical protein